MLVRPQRQNDSRAVARGLHPNSAPAYCLGRPASEWISVTEGAPDTWPPLTGPADPPRRAPAEAGYPCQPTEAAGPYPPMRAGPAYQPTEVARPYPPTEDAGPYPAARTGPAYQPTEVAGPYPAARAGPVQADRGDPAREVMRYGPGVPAAASAGQAAATAERVWRTGRTGEPPRRMHRRRGLFGSVLTVLLLAASAVLLYLRFHHAPFHVTGVAITQQTQTGCDVNVTGRISTNGSAGTVSYQWLFRPDREAPQPLSQSVVAGQDAVYVTVAVKGSGSGSASRTVTLQVLGPDRGAASTSVALRC
jgi:hypothetical protein